MEMQRQQRDRECLRDASRLLYGSLTGKGSAGYRSRDCGSVWREMEKILLYFRMEMPEPVEGMEEVQAVLDVVQAETGLLMRKIALTGEWWKEASMPLLAFDREGKALALLPGGSHRYCRAVQGGRDRLAGKDAEEFQRIAYCFYKPLPKEETGMGAFGKFLLQSLSAADVLAVFGISLLLELAGLILPYISRIVYDTVIPSGTAKELPGILVLVVSSILFSALIGLARNVWVARIGNKMAAAAQSAVWDRMFHLPVRFFRDYDSGELFGRADAVNQVCALLGGEMIPTALTALLSVIYLFQISAFARELVMPSVFIILLLTLNTGCMCFFQVRRKQEENRAGNAVTGMVCQLLGGMAKIRMAGAEARAFGRWAAAYREKPVLPGRYLQIAGVIGTAVSAGGSIYLYIKAYQSGIPASMFIAFQAAFSSFVFAVMALADLGRQAGSLKPTLEMLRPILTETPENQGGKEPVKELAGEIEICNVNFRYQEDMPYVLEQMNLRVSPGEYIGIVGGSGCGKSTLMRLLLGFERAQSGSVYYDGRDITGLDLASLRRKIGVVLQEGKLFSGDIFSNIAICAPWLSMEEAWEAAGKAGVAEDIENMPMGMFTMLSEEGGGLSGGQKQRILIARALAANPSVLLFDEATSALDNLTQAIVVKTLREMACTRLVIAHRLSTIRDCDRILYLENGRIAEEGTYETLMEKNGKFAAMARRQLA